MTSTISIIRVSYTANWFDGIDRRVAAANYGAISSFTRPSTPPSSSAIVLVTLTSYNDGGEVGQVTDPMGNVTQTSYDDAGRTTQTVEAYGTGSARTTNFTYTLDNLTATMMAVNSTTGNQTTTWTYGTNASSSSVVRNDLLASVTYPDSISGSDVVSYAYNRLGQQRTTTDQRGTIRTFYYDKLGRLTNDCVTTVGSNTDNAVLQIERAYEVRGMVQTLTSTNSATQGSGTVLNQVQLTYNTFGQLVEDQQSHSGAVGSGTPSVQYAYDTGASSSNEIRLNQLTYPNGRAVSYNFASGMDSTLNRVTSISDTSATLASYTYLGLGTVIRITYPQPSVRLDLWGGTSGTFTGFDQFGRIINQLWQNNITGTPVAIDQYQYGYDRDSNRLWKANVVGTAAVSAGLDEFYTYDPLNRLTEMQRGVLNSGKTGITGTPSIEQDWTLDPVGNWSGFITKASGTTNLNQSRTANTVNEITNITESTGPTWIVPAYDAAGNTITMPQPASPTSSFTAVYDAWNRMVSISAGSTPVGKYQYDGRNFRILTLTYTAGVLAETRHFYFARGWRSIEERIGTSGSADKQYVWGVRYIDELVCRDDAAAQRLYALQDVVFSVTGIADATGTVQQRFVYDPYSATSVLTAAWAATTDAFAWVCRFTGREYDTATQFLSYRSRIYLPPLARLASRDILFGVAAPNLYGFVGSNPIRMVDPLGLYDRDFHYDVVEYLALSRCWSADDAISVAAASQAPDDPADPRNPITLGVRGFFENLITLGLGQSEALQKLAQYHFFARPGAVVVAGDTGAAQLVQQAFQPYGSGCDSNANGSPAQLVALGEALHVFADTYAHAGFSAYPRFFFDVGHALAGTDPDMPFLNVKKAMVAVGAIYDLIPDRCCCPGDGRSKADAQIELGIAFANGTRDTAARERWIQGLITYHQEDGTFGS